MRRSLLPLGACALGLALAACAGPATTVAPWPPAGGDGQVGLASWYGKDFHGRRTASGEVYDMYQMTAAHKTLPLGTWVEVIHLETGRSIQVRVNDRGPFIAGRIIDLSYGAARVLGLLGEGVAPVRVRMLAAGPTAVAATIPLGPTPSPAPQAGRFTMQLGSFTTLENATALARTLQQRFNGVYMVPAEIDGETVYRVRMGSYPNRQEAHVAAEAVAGTGFDVVVMQQE
ncbi:MAG: septal ring lytic transglycosylase RlpA family protein [candidate division NC10 bacterium]|nr:septal ring lytic transglycosylase RlpA family protein [candidate division NC10 bacterium]